MGTSEIAGLVKQIQAAKSAGCFSPYIDFIQLYRYKNFSPDVRVTFAFPVTVLVGPNGCGKTSLLHALYGAPKNYSTGKWWFSTALDPSDATASSSRRQSLAEEEKSGFWYGYQEGGESKEVIKMRIRRRGEPDYWEPSRPIAAAGMQARQDGKRDSAITMEPIYINFKTQINAFDRCFYFSSPATLKRMEKTRRWQKFVESYGRKVSGVRIQDYIRSQANKLRRVLIDQKTITAAGHPLHRQRIALTDDELLAIGTIIGRQYERGAILEHRFYESWATSVLFSTPERTYSEAFAGSGESAVARLVHEVHSCSNGVLLLLDEPETSLHPGAQQKLMTYLLRQALKKKIQIVISTHAPSMVRYLPSEAIAVFSTGPRATVEVTQNVTADEAFYVIGHPPENKIQIIVEDRLAKLIVAEAICQLGEGFASRFQVDFRPGGADAMYQDAAVVMQTAKDTKIYFLFDGDKKPDADDPFSIANVKVADRSAVLDGIIKQATKMKVEFRENSNMSDLDKVRIRIDYLEYAEKRFHYLPFQQPESAIWDTNRAKNIVAMIEPDVGKAGKLLKEIEKENDAKCRFSRLTKLTEVSENESTSFDIHGIQRMFVKGFIASKGAEVEQLQKLLRRIGKDA